MKHITLFFVSICILTSCFGGSSEETEQAGGLTSFQGEGFSLFLPGNWNQLETKDTTLPKPKRGKVVLARVSPDIKDGFSNTLLVLSEQQIDEVDSKSFSQRNKNTSGYTQFSSLKKTYITLASGEETEIETFEAKYNTLAPKLTYLQMGVVCAQKKGFYLTIALPLNIKDTAKYEEILKTFECK